MTQAARSALAVRNGLAAATEWEAEHGSLTDTELENARRAVVAQLRDERPSHS